MEDAQEIQRVPVKMYCAEDRLVVAAPMPGLESDDIQARVTDDGNLQLHGRLRGEFKGQKDVLLDEWAVGNYERDIPLPMSVDASTATATYGNGVVVISMPITSQHIAAEVPVMSTPVHPDTPQA